MNRRIMARFVENLFFPQIVELNYRLNLTLPGLCPDAVAFPIRIGTVLGKSLKTLPTDYPIWGRSREGVKPLLSKNTVS
jgi:hypothetical protein